MSQGAFRKTPKRRYGRKIKPAKRLIVRGTWEWEERERQREDDGCRCLSYGPIPADGGRVT